MGWAKGVYTFSSGIRPKVIIIARLELKLAYNDVTDQHVNHKTTGNPPGLGKILPNNDIKTKKTKKKKEKF